MLRILAILFMIIFILFSFILISATIIGVYETLCTYKDISIDNHIRKCAEVSFSLLTFIFLDIFSLGVIYILYSKIIYS